jgi:CRISPR-associated protein Cmr5
MATIEQLRAQDAWKACENYTKEHVSLAKGLPALIMNSGLMQVMAFLHEKGAKDKQRHCRDVAEHLRAWLNRQMQVPTDFNGFMEHLHGADARRYQSITTEAFAWLRWLRQMAAARQGGR